MLSYACRPDQEIAYVWNKRTLLLWNFYVCEKKITQKNDTFFMILTNKMSLSSGNDGQLLLTFLLFRFFCVSVSVCKCEKRV